MIDLHWDAVKEFYEEKFGIEGWVVEMYANFDILILCASGASNESIETFLEIDAKEVLKVIQDTFDFDGWKEDLPVNPYKIYCDLEKEFEKYEHKDVRFMSEMTSALNSYTQANKDATIYKAYWICRTMSDIERKINDEWI
jgi:hypothetical protein